MAKGKSEEAHRLLAKYHANGDMDDELVMFEMQEIRVAMDLEREAAARGWMELVRGAGNRKRTAICTFVGWTSQFNVSCGGIQVELGSKSNGIGCGYCELLLDASPPYGRHQRQYADLGHYNRLRRLELCERDHRLDAARSLPLTRRWIGRWQPRPDHSA